MKNWGKFFILVLMILAMTACGEKGGGSSSSGNVINPYSWDELYEMINTSETTQINSRYSKNKEEISNLVNESDIKDNSIKKTYISNLVSALQSNVYTPIVAQDSTFNYYTTVELIETKNDTLVDAFSDVLGYDDLTLLYTELNKIHIGTPTAALYETLSEIRSSLDKTLNLINSRKAINPFYADAALVYYQYKTNIKPNKDFLENNYGIDIEEVDQTSNITQSLTILVEDISVLSNKVIYEKAPFSERESLIQQMNLLKNTYQDYLDGKVSLTDVDTMRTQHRNTENGIISGSGTIPDYVSNIETVLTRLNNLNTSGDTNSTNLKNELIDHIEDYKKMNTEYDNENYIVISSKVANVIEELAYLKNSNIGNLGIELPW